MKRNRIIYLTIGFAFIGLTNLFGQEIENEKPQNDTLVFTQIIQNQEIDQINNLYRQSKSEDLTFNGYRIQIFFGRNREKVDGIIHKFNEEFPEIEAERIYEEPNFKVIVGKYRTKLDAEREIQEIRKKYKSALIINPQ